jgi:hypothetical protein
MRRPAAHVRLAIYDVSGRQGVWPTAISGGRHTARWNGWADGAPSRVYFVRYDTPHSFKAIGPASVKGLAVGLTKS